MGFAAWWLNVDSFAAPGPGPGPGPGAFAPALRIMGTIIESYTNPYLRYLDDQRLKKLKCFRQRMCIRRAMNPVQFAYQLNTKFNHKVKLKTTIDSKYIDIFNTINYEPIKKEDSAAGSSPIKLRIMPNKVRVKLIGLSRKERDVAKQHFDLDEFLKFTPNKRDLRPKLFL